MKRENIGQEQHPLDGINLSQSPFLNTFFKTNRVSRGDLRDTTRHLLEDKSIEGTVAEEWPHFEHKYES